MRALSVLAARWRRHTCRDLTDAISGDVRCWCGARPAHENTLRRALHAEGARISKNGAPGVEPGTPPNTTAVKEPTMAHELIEENTPRGRQMTAALALFRLLEKDLPLARWSVDDLGRLHGHVHRPHSDTGARDALKAYGEFLRVPVVPSQGRNAHSEWVHLSASGTYRGTPVNVWTHVAIRPSHPYVSVQGSTS